MWEDSDDVGDTELQNSDESSLPVGATSPFPMNGREEHMHRPEEEQTGIILETESITTIFPALEQCLINTECSINICQADEWMNEVVALSWHIKYREGKW